MVKEEKELEDKEVKEETETEVSEEQLEAVEEPKAEEAEKEGTKEEAPEEKPEAVEGAEEKKEELAEEKKAKKPKKEKAAEEEEIVEEKFYTIPLGKAWITPPRRRAPRAMRMLKFFITKHMKLKSRKGTGEEEEEVSRLIISNEVNLRMWSRGIEKPPRKIRVRAAKDKEGNVTVYLAEGD
jgi:large subunit ribosomal protein L31e